MWVLGSGLLYSHTLGKHRREGRGEGGGGAQGEGGKRSARDMSVSSVQQHGFAAWTTTGSKTTSSCMTSATKKTNAVFKKLVYARHASPGDTR